MGRRYQGMEKKVGEGIRAEEESGEGQEKEEE